MTNTLLEENLHKYFYEYSFKDRHSSVVEIAKQITTVEEVILTLKYVSYIEIREAYDAAVELLMYCDEILLKALKEIKEEDNLEVLVSAISFAVNLNLETKYKALLDFLPDSRASCAAIIDALVHLKEEIPVDRIKDKLVNMYNSTTDTYIYNYIMEALEELQ